MHDYSDTWSEYSEYSDCIEAFMGSKLYSDENLLTMFGGAESKSHIRRVVIPRLINRYFEKNGKIGFDEEIFAEIYDEFEGYLKSDYLCYRSWALISNFDMEGERLELEEGLEIRKVRPEERSEIKNNISNRSFDRFDIQRDYLIEAKFELSKNPEGTVDLEDGIEKIEAVMTALRLFKEGGDVWYKDVLTDQHPVNYSAMGQSISNGKSPEGVLKENCEFSKDDMENFQDFWSSYKSYFFMEKENAITNPIRWFKQMDGKSIVEDAIVDSVIAFESTLLKDVGRTESYNFRLPLRASILLEENSEFNREFIYQFFKELYSVRSRVVHSGKEPDDIQIKDEEMSPIEFVSQVRELLRQTLVEYMSNLEAGNSMADVNNKIDSALRETEF